MQNVNWWLMAVAFALGLVLTLALMIRRVKREVPEYAAAKFTDASADETTKTSRGRSQRDEQW